ncbi:MAG: hypothetical protein OEW43_00170, partial [Elusimicrobiota bacterium]|nr:hypothetical protein [Elusimicrobiota bacterium]
MLKLNDVIVKKDKPAAKAEKVKAVSFSQMKKTIKEQRKITDRLEGGVRDLHESEIQTMIMGLKNNLRAFDKNTTPQEVINAVSPVLNKTHLGKRIEKQLMNAHGKEEMLNALLPIIYACARKLAAKTLKGKRHYLVQLEGAVALHYGLIVDQQTGEGKSQTASLPAMLNALFRKVHIHTHSHKKAVDDAKELMPLYMAMGFTVGVCGEKEGEYYAVVFGKGREPVLAPISRREFYQRDIVYAKHSNNEFDYSRDRIRNDAFLQDLPDIADTFTLADEVDSLHIHEARTPHITTKPGELSKKDIERIHLADAIVREILKDKELYEADKHRLTASFTEEESNQKKIENIIQKHLRRRVNIFEIKTNEQWLWLGLLHNALQAHTLYERGTDYLMEKDGTVALLSKKFTGRVMVGQRLSGGLHQAIEAKEGVTINPGSEDIDYSITTMRSFNTFNRKWAGFSGTAKAHEKPFNRVYGKQIYVVDTNIERQRKDFEDRVSKNTFDKLYAIIEDIALIRQNPQEHERPILIGGIFSDKKAEAFRDILNNTGKNEEIGTLWNMDPNQVQTLKGLASKLLGKIVVPVLNASHAEQEQQIIDQAGQKNAITIATNIAGRETDIDAKDVIEIGGLHVIGVTRSESRTVDLQLAGRAGRIGQKGSSQFYPSMDDDMYVKFWGEDAEKEQPRLCRLLDKGKEDQVRLALDRIQKRVDERNQNEFTEQAEFEYIPDQQLTAIDNLKQGILKGEKNNRVDLYAVEYDFGRVIEMLTAKVKEIHPGMLAEKDKVVFEEKAEFIARQLLLRNINKHRGNYSKEAQLIRQQIDTTIPGDHKQKLLAYQAEMAQAFNALLQAIYKESFTTVYQKNEIKNILNEYEQHKARKKIIAKSIKNVASEVKNQMHNIINIEILIDKLHKNVSKVLSRNFNLRNNELRERIPQLTHGILHNKTLSARYISSRGALIQNFADVLVNDIESLKAQLDNNLNHTLSFLTNNEMLDSFLDVEGGNLIINKASLVKQVLSGEIEKVTFNESTAQQVADSVIGKGDFIDQRPLEMGLTDKPLSAAVYDLNMGLEKGKNPRVLVLKINEGITTVLSKADKKLFEKIGHVLEGVLGTVVIIDNGVPLEKAGEVIKQIQRLSEKKGAIPVSIRQVSKDETSTISVQLRKSFVLKVIDIIWSMLSSVGRFFKKRSVRSRLYTRKFGWNVRDSVVGVFTNKKVRTAAGILVGLYGMPAAAKTGIQYREMKKQERINEAIASYENIAEKNREQFSNFQEEFESGKIGFVQYLNRHMDAFIRTRTEYEALKQRAPPDSRIYREIENALTTVNEQIDFCKKITDKIEHPGFIETEYSLTTPALEQEISPPTTKDSKQEASLARKEEEPLPEPSPTEPAKTRPADEKTEKQEEKTEEAKVQLKQLKPEKGPKEAKGSRQETEQAPLVKEVSAERASEEELFDKLSEVLSHTRYKRWADRNARVSIARRIEQVNRGERDSVKMSFHSQGEYRRTVEALKRLEEIGFIRLRLADVPEGKPAGEILNAIFAGYKLEILPPAAVVPSGESLLSEPESGEEVVVAGEEIAESERAEATKVKYNFAKVRDLLALGIYNRFIPALPEEKAKVLEEILEWKEAADPAKNLDVLIVEKLNEIAKDNDGLRVWAKGGLETYRCWFVALGIEFPIVDKTRPVRKMIGEGQNILAQVEHVNRINSFRSWVERALDTYRGQRMAVERRKREVESWQAALTRATPRKDRQVEDRVKLIKSKLLEAEAGLVLADKNAALAKNELGRLLEISPQEGFELSKDLLEITTAKIEEELKELKEMAGEIGIVETDDASRTFPGQIQAVRNALESLNNKYKEVNGAWSNIRFRGELSYSALFQFYQSDLGLIFSRGEKYSPMALMHLREAMAHGNEATLRDIREALDRAEQAVKNTERLHNESLNLANKAEEYLKKARQATEKGYLSWQDLIRAKELLRQARESKGNSLMAYAAAARTYDELNKGWSEVDKIGDFCNRVDEFVRKDKKELTKEEKRVQKEIISTMKWLLGEMKKDKKLIDRYENNPDWKYSIGYIQEEYNLKVKELKDLKETLEASLPQDSKKEKKLRDEIGGLKELAVESKVTEKVELEKGTVASYVSNSLRENPRLKQRRNKTQARNWQYRRFLREVNDKFFLFKLIDGIFGMETGTISTVGGRLEGSIKLGREDACKLKLYEMLTILAEAEEKLAEAGLAEEARNAYLDWIRSEAQRGLFLRDIKVIDNHIELKKELLMKTRDAKFAHQIADLELEKSRLERLVAQLEIERDGAKQRYAQVVGINPGEIKSEALSIISRISELSARNREFFDLFSEFQKELDKEIHNFTMLRLNTYEATLNYLEADVEVQKALRDLAKAGFKVRWDATLGHTGGFGQQIGTGALWFGQELFNFTKIADRKGEVARAEAAVEKAEEPLRFIRKFYRNEAALRKALIGLADKRSGLSWESLGSSIDSLNKTRSEAERKISGKSKEDVLVEERKVLAARRDVISSIIDTWGLLSTYVPTTEGEEVEADVDKIENEGDIRMLIEKAVDEMWSEPRANRDLAKKLEDIRQYWWAGPFSGYLMETATYVYDYSTALVPVPGTNEMVWVDRMMEEQKSEVAAGYGIIADLNRWLDRAVDIAGLDHNLQEEIYKQSKFYARLHALRCWYDFLKAQEYEGFLEKQLEKIETERAKLENKARLPGEKSEELRDINRYLRDLQLMLSQARWTAEKAQTTFLNAIRKTDMSEVGVIPTYRDGRPKPTGNVGATLRGRPIGTEDPKMKINRILQEIEGEEIDRDSRNMSLPQVQLYLLERFFGPERILEGNRGLQLMWTLIGNIAGPSKEKNELELTKLRQELQRLENDIAYDWKNFSLNLSSNYDSIEKQKLLTNHLKELWDKAGKDYSQGKITIGDYIKATEDYRKAQFGYLGVHFNLLFLSDQLEERLKLIGEKERLASPSLTREERLDRTLPRQDKPVEETISLPAEEQKIADVQRQKELEQLRAETRESAELRRKSRQVEPEKPSPEKLLEVLTTEETRDKLSKMKAIEPRPVDQEKLSYEEQEELNISKVMVEKILTGIGIPHDVKKLPNLDSWRAKFFKFMAKGRYPARADLMEEKLEYMSQLVDAKFIDELEVIVDEINEGRKDRGLPELSWEEVNRSLSHLFTKSVDGLFEINEWMKLENAWKEKDHKVELKTVLALIDYYSSVWMVEELSSGAMVPDQRLRSLGPGFIRYWKQWFITDHFKIDMRKLLGEDPEKFNTQRAISELIDEFGLFFVSEPRKAELQGQLQEMVNKLYPKQILWLFGDLQSQGKLRSWLFSLLTSRLGVEERMEELIEYMVAISPATDKLYESVDGVYMRTLRELAYEGRAIEDILAVIDLDSLASEFKESFKDAPEAGRLFYLLNQKAKLESQIVESVEQGAEESNISELAQKLKALKESIIKEAILLVVGQDMGRRFNFSKWAIEEGLSPEQAVKVLNNRREILPAAKTLLV